MTKTGRPPKYPWTEWLVLNTARTITYGVDFKIAPSSMVSMLRQQASKRKFHIEVTENPLTQSITFSFSQREVGDEGEEPLLREAPKETSTEVPVVELDGREPPHSHI